MPLLPGRRKDWFSVVESWWVREGTRKGAALVCRPFKMALKDQEAPIRQEG